MTRGFRSRLVLVLTVSAWLMVVVPAHAYIDGGSVSVVFQALVAGMAALGTGLAISWNRITRWFRRDHSGGDASPEPDAAAEDHQRV